jgi:PKD repeat protein
MVVQLFSFSQQLPPGFNVTTISTWDESVGVTFTPDGLKMFVWQRNGRVFVNNWNVGSQTYIKQNTPVADIFYEVGNWGDHGLLGFALDPQFSSNGYIYLFFVVDRHHLLYAGTPGYDSTGYIPNAATIGRICRFTTFTNASQELVVNYASRVTLLGETISTGVPILSTTHGVGSLVFGTDGTLLASTGDGAEYGTIDTGNNAASYYALGLSSGIIRPEENVGAFRSQMINSHSGKILRLDPATGNGIPSNPYYDAGNPRSAKSRLWSLGYRNPYRITLKPNSGSSLPSAGNPGEIYIGDVGWNAWEDLTILQSHESALNAGWPLYEGLQLNTPYSNLNNLNKDEPNPLFGQGGCTQEFFKFKDLFKEATADNNQFLPNPCNTSIPITSPNLNRFVHKRPLLDWSHVAVETRVGIFNGNNASTALLGSPESGVEGTPFMGFSSTAGTWYTGTSFPSQYHNTYFHADYAARWIKNLEFHEEDNHLHEVNGFAQFPSASNFIVYLTMNPLDGALYYIDYYGFPQKLKKISFNGNLFPTAVLSSNISYGPSPLMVNFQGDQSTDPDGTIASYQWDFGDGSPSSTSANPTHTFITPDTNPKKFTVKLTVTDNAGASHTDSLIISANNTPPVVDITSLPDTSWYTVGPDSTINLAASVTDAEQSAAGLIYGWQTTLYHNTHNHPGPINPNPVTTATIERVGCDGETYFYTVVLKVTDTAGLSGSDTVWLLPNCNQPPIANAGPDMNATYPEDTVLLNGTASFDPDSTSLSYLWTKISGPPSGMLSGSDSSVALLINPELGEYLFELRVTDSMGVTDRDTVQINYNPDPLSITGDTINCSKVYTIVVLGSSTAFGTGASPVDSSWVNKYRNYIRTKNPLNNIINLATLSLTTYHVLCPTGFVPPLGRPSPDIDRNITKALSYNPDAIIINLPSNDIALGYSQLESKDNYERAMELADSAGVPVWVTTTQPRTNLSPAERIQLMEFRDWTYQRFGTKAIDFWTDVANPDGTINAFYSAGDNVHVNNNGHHVFYTRTVSERILDTLCLRTELSICPGGSVLINAQLSGVSYQWQVDQGSGFTNISNGGVYSNATTSVLSISNAPSSMYGYKYRCQVNGNIYSDTHTLKFSATWEGASNTSWNNISNWSCGSLPDANTDVIIKGGKPYYPDIISNTTIRSLQLNSGSTVNVAPGVTLTVLK